MNTAPGWYSDPHDPAHERWWDGQQWTPATRPRAVPVAAFHDNMAEGASSAYVPAQPASKGYSPNVVVALIASAGVIVGSIAPWATFLAFSKNGIEGDGGITLIAGALAALTLFKVLTSRRRVNFVVRWMSPIAGALCMVIALVGLSDVASMRSEFLGRVIGAQVGWGLWLVLLSSIVLCFTATTVARRANVD